MATTLIPQKNTVKPNILILGVLNLITSFFRGIFYAYIVTIIFALITILVVDTDYNVIIGFAFSATPAIGRVQGDLVHYDQTDIPKFFAFWGLIFGILEYIVRKITKKKISINRKYIFWTVTILHLSVLIKFSILEEFSFALTFSLISYILFIIFWSFYQITTFPKILQK